MNQERWARIKDVFTRACEMADAEREIYIRAREAENPELAAEVRRLLKVAEAADGFLEPPAPAQLETPLRRLSFDFVGCLLGEFELIREIGRGATGVVFLGRQPSLGRDVAIKILAPQLCHSEERRERFRREALAASKIRHPNVVSVLSFDELSGVNYIVMEYVRGHSLHDALEAARKCDRGSRGAASALAITDPNEAARIAEAVARGLAACHQAGVLHRDVKPHNILIDQDGEPRIVDFGLAKDLGLAGLSDPGSLSGTPQYMSPEQAQARGSTIDARTDVYSAGAVLYELLTLQPPFNSSNTAHVLHQVVHERPIPVRELVPNVPRPLASICMRAISREREDRFPTALAFADDLRRFREGRFVIPHLRSAFRSRFASVVRNHPWSLAAVSAVALLSLGSDTNFAADSLHRSAAESSHVPLRTQVPASVLQHLHEQERRLPDDPKYH